MENFTKWNVSQKYWKKVTNWNASQPTRSLMLLSASSVAGYLSLIVLQPPLFMLLWQVDWNSATRSWWACLWL